MLLFVSLVLLFWTPVLLFVSLVLLFWTPGSENEKGKLKRKGEGKGKGEKIKSKLNSFSSESDRTEFSLRFGRVLHMLLGSL